MSDEYYVINGKAMSKWKAAWCAGVFECKGHIGLTDTGCHQITISMPNLDVIATLKHMTGIGQFHQCEDPAQKHGLLYFWQITGEKDCRVFMELTWEFLGIEKQKQWDMLYEDNTSRTFHVI